jgi:hypothetical protein
VACLSSRAHTTPSFDPIWANPQPNGAVHAPTVLITVALALSLSVIGLTDRPASAQMMPKAQVANFVAQAEDGVDEFRNYLEKRGDSAREASSTTQASGAQKAPGRRKSEGQRQQQERTRMTLGDLNRSTNRLRRRFDPTDKWIGDDDTAKTEPIGMTVGDCGYS